MNTTQGKQAAQKEQGRPILKLNLGNTDPDTILAKKPRQMPERTAAPNDPKTELAAIKGLDQNEQAKARNITSEKPKANREKNKQELLAAEVKRKSKYRISNEQYSEILGKARELYPGAFGEVKLLAVKIHKELIHSLGFARTSVRKFLRKYCHTKEYKSLLQEGTARYDLAGNVAGTVKAEEVPARNRNKAKKRGIENIAQDKTVDQSGQAAENSIQGESI